MKFVARHNETVFVWENFVQVLVIHLVTFLVAPLLFTWQSFLFGFAMVFLFGYPMGIFHHMLLTHRSYKCKKWIENLGSLLGTLTWRGPFAGPVRYVAMHKIHHAYADTDLDPHTPTKGIWFALLTWFWQMPRGFTRQEDYFQYCPEMARDRFHVFLDSHVHLVQAGWGVVCFGIGALAGESSWDWLNGVRFVVFGVFVRAFLSIYLINAVDVINHTVGYRSYETNDLSTNSFLMASIHLGGAISWHNNHHAHQHYFHVKKNWWEFDVHHQFLKALSQFGLVWDILVLDETQPRVVATPHVADGRN